MLKIQNLTFEHWLQALKIAAGSGAAMYVASLLQLEFAASAGMVTFLTIVTTKWETLKLSAARVLTFFIAAILAWATFGHIQNDGIAFGLFAFFLIMISEGIGWRVTASVNAVIGTHFLTVRDFSAPFIMNELMIVLIGISIAVIVNLYQNNGSLRNKIIDSMRHTEQEFSNILEQIAGYLSSRPAVENVWEKLRELEKSLTQFTEQAYRYQNNTFQSHTSYYTSYFEMRARQCEVLSSLHSEMDKLKELPKQAEVIAAYIRYMKNYVTEMNVPKKQLSRLEEIFREMKSQELPASREEFESRAVLYHILMDLEEFLKHKQQFLERIDSTQFRIYWKKEVEDFKYSSK